MSFIIPFSENGMLCLGWTREENCLTAVSLLLESVNRHGPFVNYRDFVRSM